MEGEDDDDGEEHTIEELGSSSIGFRTSNGHINISHKARQSRLASLHLASSPSPRPSYLASSPPPPPPKSEKRKTVLPVSRPLPVPPEKEMSKGSLGLFPRESIGDGKRSNERGRERTPLSTLAVGNEAEVQGGRKTWGALSLKNMSRWVSGGGGY
jgi:hypothetical protein